MDPILELQVQNRTSKQVALIDLVFVSHTASRQSGDMPTIFNARVQLRGVRFMSKSLQLSNGEFHF